MSFSEGYSIILDPDTLPDINVIEDYLQQSPGKSYKEEIYLKKNKNIINFIKKNKNINFKKNNILNFPYQKKRETNDGDLNISVLLLCHGGSSSFGTRINKEHNFWEGDRESHMILNCNGESVIGMKANTVRLYNDVGSNVRINDNIYKILIGMFYLNSIVCLLLFYLTLNLFRSRTDNKIYPYKKLYTIGRQTKIIPNPLKNIKNNSNVQNDDFEKVTKDKKFHYYIPNSRLGIEGSIDLEDENYICFMIENKGILKFYKFMLSYDNIVNILKYNNVNNINADDFISELNIADIITIIYNTIEKKILPEYDINYNLHISFDLMFCKGLLVPEDYVLTKKNNNKCYELTNDFGYIYLGHIKNCISQLCETIKELNLSKKKEGKETYKVIYISDFFKKIINLDFDLSFSTETVDEFITQLITNENKLNTKVLSILKNIFNNIQKLQITDFIQKGSGRKSKSKSISKKASSPKPSIKLSTKPSPKPSPKPSTKPSTKSVKSKIKANTEPSTKPFTKPSTKSDKSKVKKENKLNRKNVKIKTLLK